MRDCGRDGFADPDAWYFGQTFNKILPILDQVKFRLSIAIILFTIAIAITLTLNNRNGANESDNEVETYE